MNCVCVVWLMIVVSVMAEVIRIISIGGLVSCALMFICIIL